MWRFIFIGAVLVSLVSVVCRKRQIDLYTVSILGGCLYFLPGVLGYVRLWIPGGRLATGVPDVVYQIMVLVLMSLVSSMYLFDSVTGRNYKTGAKSSRHNIAGLVVLLVGLVFFALFVYDLGSTIMETSKARIYEERNTTIYNVALYSAMTAAVYGVVVRSKITFLGALLVLVLDSVLVMNRTFIVLGVLAAAVVYLNSSEERRLSGAWRWVGAAVVFTWAMLGYHHVKDEVKAGEFKEAAERLGEPSYIAYAVVTSEPFTTQAILTKVVEENFRIDLVGYGKSWLSIIPSGWRAMGKPDNFSDEFQPALFPGVGTPGIMAENFWAQAWAAGRWPMLLLVVGGYVGFVWILNVLLRRRNPFIITWASLLGVWVGFYIHRNDVVSLMVACRRITLVMLVIFLGYALVSDAVRGYRATLDRTR